MKDFFKVFVAFMGVGALTFGGGYAMLPILHKYIVEKRKWVTEEEVSDFYAISQCLPGVIAVNTSMMIGHKHSGYRGMIAAALGVIFPSLVIIIVIALFLQNLMQYEIARHAFNGIRVAVLALILQTTLRLWKIGVRDKLGIVIFAVSLTVLTVVGLSPALPLAVGGVCGLLIKRKEGALS